MSQWTHVAGVIRIDALRDGDERDIQQHKALKELFRTWSYMDRDSKRNKCNVPYGSEGSIQVKIVPGEDHSLAAYVILLWGDLRDFGDAEDIRNLKKWWKNLIDKFEHPELAPPEIKNHYFMGIRQAFLKVEVEGKDKPIILGK